MKVKEAIKEIENIQKAISVINDVEPSEMQRVFNDIEGFNKGADWKTTKLHIVNSMMTYRNILKERIENAEINLDLWR